MIMLHIFSGCLVALLTLSQCSFSAQSIRTDVIETHTATCIIY